MPSLAHPQPSTSVDAIVPLPPTMPVLDVEGSLALLDGSLPLYCEIAQAYLLELDQLPANAKRQLQHADLTEAVRTLHTFKGLSLTVGAHALSEVCRQCEMQTKAALHSGQAPGEAVCLRMVEELQGAVHATRQALERALLGIAEPNAERTEGPKTLPEDAIGDLRALKVVLLQSDLQALDLFKALHSRHALLDGRVEALAHALNAFDFAEAVVQCDDLIRSLGSSA